MTTYLLRRLLFIVPTLLGVMVLNFVIVQAAPGGPIERVIAQIKGTQISHTARFSGSTSEFAARNQQQTFSTGSQSSSLSDKYQGSRGIDPELIRDLEKQYGFDQPPLTRFTTMLTNYATFDFGDSFYRDRSVVQLIIDKLPVSISLGLWTFLLVYLISIPLGIRKAVHDGSPFDIASSAVIIIGYAIPGFLFAILLIILFAGGSFFDIFPLRGLTSDNWQSLPWYSKITDYLWHITLPVISMVISGFASLTLLTKNSFLDEIHKTYVITARAKGLSEPRILYGHVFRNAMLIVIAGFPGAFITIFFTGSLLIEVIFSLDGLGLLSFEAALGRDYPVLFATLYIYTLLGLLIKILGDVMYVIIDPRIDFESRTT
ncbi:MAG: microcin C ABC transporter permease YejB [Alphaproteobacteria bacterium GM202ARS2]|nr:microcin C ABC transporter permease YejB [Alphaproteobacteria bacterium GM202ARS2]